MANLNGFNAADVDPAVGFDPVPANKYVAIITESEYKPTKAGTGQYLQLTLQIVEGEYKGRLLWARLNLDNPSEMAVKIARAELSAICRATGVMSPKDSFELHNLPIVIKVACKKREDSGEINNEIRGYESRKRMEAVGGVGGVGAGAANGSPPPWKR